MKFLKVLLLTILMLTGYNAMANHHEIKCEIKLRSAGVWFKYCPAGTIADAAATSGNVTGGPYPHLFLRSEVRCVEPVIKCEKVVDNDTEEE